MFRFYTLMFQDLNFIPKVLECLDFTPIILKFYKVNLNTSKIYEVKFKF